MTTRPTTKLEAFNFWECHRIGINVRSNGKYSTGYDLTLDEAKELKQQLESAIHQFESYEEEYKEYEEKERGENDKSI
jgi:flagellar biosynthesis/type III secretory pathway ATPase